MIQTTLFQLDDYGPWTVQPTPRSEMDLQVLQARLYANIAAFVGDREGYAFYTRGDNIIGITNGLDREEHERLQASLRNRYPVTVSFGIGTGETPRTALEAASAALQTAGSAQDETRTGVCRGKTLIEDRMKNGTSDENTVHVAHFDIESATEQFTDRLDAFETYTAIHRWCGSLARHLYRTHDALSFFVGGDNVVSICPAMDEQAYHDVIDHVTESVGIPFRVGVGAGRTAHKAGLAAKYGLERGRERKQSVVITEQPQTVSL